MDIGRIELQPLIVSNNSENRDRYNNAVEQIRRAAKQTGSAIPNPPALNDQIAALIAALQEQTKAINNLAASNMALVEQMAKEAEEQVDTTDIDGPQVMSRKR